MGRKPQVQARVPQDVKDAMDEYCEENDLSQSDAVRRALENEYVDEEGDFPFDEAEGDVDRFSVNETARLVGPMLGLGVLIVLGLGAVVNADTQIVAAVSLAGGMIGAFTGGLL